MANQGKYTLILVAAIAVCLAALVASVFFRRLAASILGDKLWQQLVVLAVCGLVVTVSFEIGRQAWRMLAKSH